MRELIFVAVLLLTTTQGYTQNDYNGYHYYQEVAGDTALSRGKIPKEHLGDTIASDYNMDKGLYRLIIHPNINIQTEEL